MVSLVTHGEVIFDFYIVTMSEQLQTSSFT